MRLINVRSFCLEEFTPPVTIPYAILSHTWEQDEVTLQDMENAAKASAKAGYTKIRYTCNQALKDGYDYAWVDTCCIDKTSSAELSEAINSMFTWYQGAAVCYVYISERMTSSQGSVSQQFKNARWFTSGWTLQELLAPSCVRFFDRSWAFIGTRDSLRDSIARITRIDKDVLDRKTPLSSVPAARKMAWASHRRTTRTEDIAYCLLGIFDINMPVLYGEGLKAFIRLQEEIIKNSADFSLFAWRSESICYDKRGVLAYSPREFHGCASISSLKTMSQLGSRVDLTNKGLHVTGVLLRTYSQGLILPLQCCFADGRDDLMPQTGKEIGILLRKTADGYVRTEPSRYFDIPEDFSWTALENGGAPNFYLSKLGLNTWEAEAKETRVSVKTRPRYTGFSFHRILRLAPQERWDPHSSLFISTGLDPFLGHVVFEIQAVIDEEAYLGKFSLDFQICQKTSPAATNWADLGTLDGPIGNTQIDGYQRIVMLEQILGEGGMLEFNAQLVNARERRSVEVVPLVGSGYHLALEASIIGDGRHDADGASGYVVEVSIDVERDEDRS